MKRSYSVILGIVIFLCCFAINASDASIHIYQEHITEYVDDAFHDAWWEDASVTEKDDGDDTVYALIIYSYHYYHTDENGNRVYDHSIYVYFYYENWVLKKVEVY